MPFTSNISDGYKRIFVLYVRPALIAAKLVPGLITVAVQGGEQATIEGTLNGAGNLSGMAALYDRYNLKSGDTISYEVSSQSSIIITGINGNPPTSSPSISTTAPTPQSQPEGGQNNTTQLDETVSKRVFEKQNLQHIHIDLWAPENLGRWEPHGEPDVYLAFGHLQEFTRYRYCCATSIALLNRLGYAAPNKPDAILIDAVTKHYLIAEFKMRSSDFSVNHHKDHIDVLIVWDDDMADKTMLPKQIVCLRDIARTVALDRIAEG